MQYIIAAEPKDVRNASSFRQPVAHIAYKIGRDARLYRSEDAANIEVGYMVLGSDGDVRYDDYTLAEIINECKLRRFRGVFANFDSSPLLPRLSKSLAEQNLRLIVTETAGSDNPNAWVLISTALSGGTLKRRLGEAAQKFGAGRIVLDVERIIMEFVPPVPDGEGRALSREEFESLRAGHRHTPFFSYELCCNYFVFFEGDTPHIVLYDDVGSIKNKLYIASSLGIDKAMFLYSETQDILMNL